MKTILITGGAGYIGSQTILEIMREGKYTPISIDNYSNSSPRSLAQVEFLTGSKAQNINIDLADRQSVQSMKDKLGPIEAVIHFAALKSVPDSTRYPIKYYQQNINSLLNILEVCDQLQIAKFIFSSSCSIYGNVETLPVSEFTEASNPLSPYAHSKLLGEEIIRRISELTNIQTICLRYFNPVGADYSGLLGEDSSSPPDNLVPMICETASGRRSSLSIFGNDYPTRDGTCIRDYVHVVDIAKAHLKAVDYLAHSTEKKSSFEAINLGSGCGVSVLEAINAFEKVNGLKVNHNFEPRRRGDVAKIFSDCQKARELLTWEPEFSIDQMMHSAWIWHNTLETLKTSEKNGAK